MVRVVRLNFRKLPRDFWTVAPIRMLPTVEVSDRSQVVILNFLNEYGKLRPGEEGSD